MRVGIDFGTTRTVVAAVDGGRYPLAAFDVGDGFVDYVPGLAMMEGGQLRTGWDAAPLAGRGDRPTVRSIKRLVSSLAPDETVPGFGLTALELLTEFLAGLGRALRERSNLGVGADEPLEAMVAVPANASSRQRYVTLEAFRAAGFEVLGMVNEPTAAAIDYAHRKLRNVGPGTPKRYVVIYDLGGGTFDTAAVSLIERRFELLTSDGIARLGGDDFDEAILAMALEAAGASDAELSPASRVALLEACREAKERLAPNARKLLVDLCPAFPGRESAATVLDVAALFERVQPLIDETLGPIARVFERLADHDVDPEDPRQLGALYLVGGAVAFPAVTRALRTLYKRKLELAPSPHAATAVGLAVKADPEERVLVNESVTRHFGVWREDDAGRVKVFDPILSKDALPDAGGPIVVTRRYHPAHAVGHLRFLECSRLEQGEPAGDITPWREILVDYDPDAATAKDRAELARIRLPSVAWDEVVERYVYERDGSVSVEIENPARGTRSRFELGALGGAGHPTAG
jgi:molecular chaperone DnaK (HSP70)